MKLLAAVTLCGELLTSVGHKAVDQLRYWQIFEDVVDEPDGMGGYTSRPLTADEIKIEREIELRKKWRRKE